MAAEGPEKIVFVSGAPRSGTTVTHALICTSERVNQHSPEISFFRGVPMSYRIGKIAWDQHTSAFFESQEEFLAHIRDAAEQRMRFIWKKLGCPPVLAVKDPHMTPMLYELAEIFPEQSRFITVVRNPYDVVRSRQEVHERDTTEPFTAAHARIVAEEWNRYYTSALASDLGGRQFAFRYEGLNRPEVQADIAKFLDLQLHVRPMWGRKAEPSDDPWHSPKYFQPINLDPRLSPLAEELKAATRSICGGLMKKLGYGEMDLAA